MAGTTGSVQESASAPAAHTFTLVTQTPALNQPFGVALYQHGSTSLLYATELGTGHVHRYDISGASPVETGGPFLTHMADAGAVTDTAVGWHFPTFGSWIPGGDAAIAVSPDGSTFGVVDLYNSRTMFYSTADGSVVASPRFMGFNFPAPQADLFVPSGAGGSAIGVDEDSLTSGWMQYQVLHNVSDPNYGHPFSLQYNWQPIDDPAVETYSLPAMHRRLSNGNEYLYYVMEPNESPQFPWGGIVVYRLNSTSPGLGMKRCAEIRISNQNSTLEVRTDTDGNGILDDGAGNPDPGDAPPVTRAGTFGLVDADGVWIDADGTIWFPTLVLDNDYYDVVIGKLPISTFDSKLNPVYDISSGGPLTRVYSYPLEPTYRAWPIIPDILRHDPINNRLFLCVSTPNRVLSGGGGSAAWTMDLTNGQQSVAYVPTQAVPFQQPQPPGTYAFMPQADVGGLSADTDGNYFYAGSNSVGGASGVRMFTWDGLSVSRAIPNVPVNAMGSFDNPISLTAFTHSNGTHYAYAEDIFFGRYQRFAFSNVPTTVRWGTNPNTGDTGGNFTWTGPSTLDGLAAWWRMDETNGQYVIDSSGNGHHFGELLYGGQPTPGHSGGARSFNGAATDPSAVTLSRNISVPQADRLIDNGSSSTPFTVTGWVNVPTNSPGGVVVGVQDQAFRPDQNLSTDAGQLRARPLRRPGWQSARRRAGWQRDNDLAVGDQRWPLAPRRTGRGPNSADALH